MVCILGVFPLNYCANLMSPSPTTIWILVVFMLSRRGYGIVEIIIEGKNPISSMVMIDGMIRLRGLRDRVRVGCIGGVMYLKKL